MTSRSSSASASLLLSSRVAAAVAGGYALAAATAIFLASVLPASRAEGVIAGMQLSFVVYTAAVVWAFSPISLARAWAGLLLPAAVLAGLGWAMRGMGG
jgi:hypothetical protein